jgi:hypothetical protein
MSLRPRMGEDRTDKRPQAGQHAAVGRSTKQKARTGRTGGAGRLSERRMFCNVRPFCSEVAKKRGRMTRFGPGQVSCPRLIVKVRVSRLAVSEPVTDQEVVKGLGRQALVVGSPGRPRRRTPISTLPPRGDDSAYKSPIVKLIIGNRLCVVRPRGDRTRGIWSRLRDARTWSRCLRFRSSERSHLSSRASCAVVTPRANPRTIRTGWTGPRLTPCNAVPVKGVEDAAAMPAAVVEHRRASAALDANPVALAAAREGEPVGVQPLDQLGVAGVRVHQLGDREVHGIPRCNPAGVVGLRVSLPWWTAAIELITTWPA